MSRSVSRPRLAGPAVVEALADSPVVLIRLELSCAGRALRLDNPHHPSLRLHALSGRLQGLHSVSINLSYRITLELLIRDRQIVPINVGDHDAVY